MRTRRRITSRDGGRNKLLGHFLPLPCNYCLRVLSFFFVSDPVLVHPHRVLYSAYGLLLYVFPYLLIAYRRSFFWYGPFRERSFAFRSARADRLILDLGCPDLCDSHHIETTRCKEIPSRKRKEQVIVLIVRMPLKNRFIRAPQGRGFTKAEAPTATTSREIFAGQMRCIVPFTWFRIAPAAV